MNEFSAATEIQKAQNMESFYVTYLAAIPDLIDMKSLYNLHLSHYYEYSDKFAA